MEFVASPYGLELSAHGVPLDQILRTPRAIDQMYVELEKRRLSPEDRAAVEHYLERPPV
jgi:hypothetical protein